MDELLKEISDMEDLTTANTSAPITDIPGTSAPSTDLPSTDAPGTDAPSTDVPTTDAPSEFDIMKAENEELLARIEKLEKPSTETPSTNAPSTDAPIVNENFLDDLDLDDLIHDPDKFNELLNTVFKKGIKVARDEVRSGQEGVLRSIPDIVKTNITMVTNLRKARDEFYDKNKDLEPFKNVVSLVFEEEAAKDPSKTYSEVLTMVGPEVRKRLDLHNKANSNSPRLPSRKGQSRKSLNQPDPDPLQSEIDQMNKILDG